MIKLNNRNNVYNTLVYSDNSKKEEEKVTDMMIEELKKLYIQNATPQRKRKLDSTKNPIAKKARVEDQDKQARLKYISTNIALADITAQVKKLKRYNIRPIMDSAPSATSIVINQTKFKERERGF